MNKEIINKLIKEEFKYIEIQGKNIVLSNGNINEGKIYPEFICNNQGTFMYERSNYIQITDFNDTNLNLLGLYCIVCKKNKPGKDNTDKILNAKSIDEIKRIFFENFSVEFLNQNVSFEINNTGEIYIEPIADFGYKVYIRKGSNLCNMGCCLNDHHQLYKLIFEILIAKREFEDRILSNMITNEYSEEELLKLYGMYKHEKKISLEKIEQKNKSR